MPEETKTDSMSDFDEQLKELTAEVEKYSLQAKSAASNIGEHTGDAGDDMSLQGLPERIDNLEKQFGEFSQQLSESVGGLAEQIGKQISLESANEKLFNAMHKELQTYKDDTLVDSLQKPFLLDLIALYDNLEMVFTQLSDEGLGDQVSQPRSNLENTLHYIDEMLARLSVERIELSSGKLDGRYQRAVGFEEVTDESLKDTIMEVRRCGYTWRNRVLRPENVIIGRLVKESSGGSEQAIVNEEEE